MDLQNIPLNISNLLDSYKTRAFTPQQLVEALLEKNASLTENPIWITCLTIKQIQPYLDRLSGRSVEELPLFGIPFAIKDNIDLTGVPTTAACPDYAYIPEKSAFVVERLISAGAIPLGKTNMDQFASGLVGPRSPFGVTKNCFDPRYISGGSSSGSAAAVASGLVSFSLGTDTAGSGRVPAALNNLIGVKPTLGTLSCTGVVPACRTLDCVSIFALNIDDGEKLHRLLAHYDGEDSYARRQQCRVPQKFDNEFIVAVPREDQLLFFGDHNYPDLFNLFVENLTSIGATVKTVDFSPFIECAQLLYDGPWLAERYAALSEFLATSVDSFNAVTRAIIEPANKLTAVDAFRAEYRRMALKRQVDDLMQSVDYMVTPTVGGAVTQDEVNADPIGLNTQLGYYTNFMNLLDLSALAIPAGFSHQGLPFGVTLIGKAFDDLMLCQRARQILSVTPQRQGATDCVWREHQQSNSDSVARGYVNIAVCGAHLSGMPLNSQLTERKAILLEKTKTAPCYSLYALAGGPPYRPGLIKQPTGGAAIEVEVWQMPTEHVGSFIQGIPAPLGIGSVELADRRSVNGFICEGYAIGTAEDITHLGSWRNFKHN